MLFIMESINPNSCYAFHDSFENLINHLPDLFKMYDEIDFVWALDDNDFWLLENLVIPNWKVLYVNPKRIEKETLLEFRELIQWNPGIKLHDEIWQEIDFDEFVYGSKIKEVYAGDDIGKVLTDSWDLIDPDK